MGEDSELNFDMEAKNLASEIDWIKSDIDKSLSDKNFTV